jgi:tetratricopeptide (TPR) repeat protein
LAQQALKMFPEGSNCLRTLGVAYYRDGSPQKALKSLQKSIELRGEEKAIDGFLLAMVYWGLGQFDEARSAFRRASERTELQNTNSRDWRLDRVRGDATIILGAEPELDREPAPDSNQGAS